MVSKTSVSITLDELRTLAGSAIVDIHEQVDEVFCEGLCRCSEYDWTSEALREKREWIVGYFNRAIWFLEALETTASREKTP